MRNAIRFLARGTSPAPGVANGPLKIAANAGSLPDYASELVFVDLARSFRGFTLTTDPYGNSTPRPALDANGYPTQDFAVTVPMVPYSASAQTLKCQLSGLATITASVNGSIANQLVSGDITTFDLNIAAGANPVMQAVLTLTATKRTAASAVNTGCTGLIMKAPGYSIADTTIFAPNYVAFVKNFKTLRFMDFSNVNGDITTTASAQRASNTHFLPQRFSVEDACRLCNLTGCNLWWNYFAASSDSLITDMATSIRTNLSTSLYSINELCNENWNYGFSQHQYWMDLAMAMVSGFSGGFSSNRNVVSANRTSNVTTVTTSLAHGYAANQVVGINAIGSVYGRPAIIAVPTTTTFTISDPGANGSVPVGGGSSVVGNFTNALNSYDSAYDQFVLQRRYYARRTVQMSALIQTVFGSPAFGTRAKIGLFNQPGNGQRDQLGYVNQVHGAPNTFIHGIGEASYFFFDATPFGGPNLRNVTTYNGYTPPAIADYVSTLAITAGNAQVGDKYDETVITARLYGLKMWQYEFGPDITASPPNSAGSAVGQQKINALFDPSFKPAYKDLLHKMAGAGFEEVALYSAGPAPIGSSNEYLGWGIVRGYTDTTSPRLLAVQEVNAEVPAQGLNRNLLLATGTTIIDGRFIAESYSATGAYPQLDGAFYVITAQQARTYSFVLAAAVSSPPRVARLYVNGALVSTYTFNTAGNVTMAAVTVTLTLGTNVIQFTNDGVDYLGNLVTCTSLSFT